MLSVIVIDFRSSALVDGCVRALLAGSMVPDEIIVIDNEARGREPAPTVAQDPRVRYVARPDNPGYAASCNAGVALASGKTLLFMNADVTVEPQSVERCYRALTADPTVAIVTPRLVRPDGTLDHACHRGLPTAGASLAYKLRLHRLFPGSRRLGRYTMSWLDPATDHDVEACSGAFLLVRRADLDRAGGWDERYRFYAEDLDLCLRVCRDGHRVRYLGSVTATHLKGAFSHYASADDELAAGELEVKRWAQREVIASHRLFFEEHMRERSAWPVRAAIELLFVLQTWRLDVADRFARA